MHEVNFDEKVLMSEKRDTFNKSWWRQWKQKYNWAIMKGNKWVEDEENQEILQKTY